MRQTLHSNCVTCPFREEHALNAQAVESKTAAGIEDLEEFVPEGLALALEFEASVICLDGPTFYEHDVLGRQVSCPAKLTLSTLGLVPATPDEK